MPPFGSTLKTNPGFPGTARAVGNSDAEVLVVDVFGEEGEGRGVDVVEDVVWSREVLALGRGDAVGRLCVTVRDVAAADRGGVEVVIGRPGFATSELLALVRSLVVVVVVVVWSGGSMRSRTKRAGVSITRKVFTAAVFAV